MKKLLLLGLICITALKSATQGTPFPQYQFSGSPTTLFEGRGALQGKKGLVNGTYTDTTQANLGHIDFYPGAQIFTTSDNFMWLRNSTATRWIQQGSVSNITINNIINNSTTTVTILNDSIILICDGDGACDTINISSTTVTNINNAYFINDSSIVVCDTPQVIVVGDVVTVQEVCDTITVPAQELFIVQNYLTQVAPGLIEAGGTGLHNTTFYTDYHNILFSGRSLYHEPVAFQQEQYTQYATTIASFRSYGHSVISEPDFNNGVRLYVNYTNRIADPPNMGYMGDRIGYMLNTNFRGGGPYWISKDNAASKVAGIMFHTLDTGNIEGVTIFADEVIPSPGDPDYLLPSRVAIFKTDQDIRFPNYPDSRDDGGTSKALYTDNDGNVLYGPINGGDVINIITDSSITICSFGTQLCDTFVTNILSGPIQTVEILNDSTIIVCDSLSVCDTLTIPQTNLAQPITADNGLIMSTPTNVQLGAPTFPGAPLLHHTYIDATANYTLRLTGSISNQAVYQVYNTGTGQAILAQATGTGTALNARNIGATGTAINAYSANGLPVVIGTQPVSTNTVVQMIKIQRETSGTAANGIGASIDFISEVDNGNSTLISNRIISSWTTAAMATRVSQFLFTGVDNATTQDIFALNGNGSARAHFYGDGVFTGTATYLIATDANGNLIEYPSGGLSGGLITADNGLTMSTATNVQLFGPVGTPATLLNDRYLTAADKTLNITFNSLAAGNSGLKLTSTSTAATTGSKVLEVSRSGALAAGQNTYGIHVTNSHSGGVANVAIFGTIINSNASGAAIRGEASGDGAGIIGIAGTGNAVNGSSTSGAGGSFLTSSGTGISVVSTSGTGATIQTSTGTMVANLIANPATTSTIVTILRLSRNTSDVGGGDAGIGGAIDFYNATDATLNLSARIASTWTDPANASRTGDLQFHTTNNAVTGLGLTLTGDKRLILTGRLETVQGADVASVAGAIAVGFDGNKFELTGTNAVTLISNLGWVNGNEITFYFTGAATLTDGTANSGTDIGMELAGNANFVGSADDVLTLELCEIGGTQRWREKSRSVN